MIGFISAAFIGVIWYRESSKKDAEISRLKYDLERANQSNDRLKGISLGALDEKEAMIRLCEQKGIDYREAYSDIMREVRVERETTEAAETRARLLSE